MQTKQGDNLQRDVIFHEWQIAVAGNKDNMNWKLFLQLAAEMTVKLYIA